MDAIRIKIIHRNRLFRECLVGVLSGQERFTVTEVDHTRPGYLEEFAIDGANVVLLDLNLPGEPAVKLVPKILGSMPSARIVVLAHQNDLEQALECLAAGAFGCVLEESSVEELRHAVEKVVGGEIFCSSQMVKSMFEMLAQSGRPSAWRQPEEAIDLTPRELEVLHLVAEHLSNKQIAKRLDLSLHTVKNHVHNLVEKLKVDSRYTAVEYARQRRWLKQPGSSDVARRDS